MPELKSIVREQSGTVQAGERFAATYVKPGKETATQATVTTCEPPHTVTFEYRMTWNSVEQVARISYQILPRPKGVRVVQKSEYILSGVAWPWRLLIWFIGHFGKPVGEQALDALKKVVESAGMPSSTK